MLSYGRMLDRLQNGAILDGDIGALVRLPVDEISGLDHWMCGKQESSFGPDLLLRAGAPIILRDIIVRLGEKVGEP